MAESQDPYNYGDSYRAIAESLSTARFSPYRIAAGYDDDYAFKLYLYNARLAKSLLFPIHILEVVLRNKINSILSEKFSSDWHLDHNFNKILTAESFGSLQKSMSKVQDRGIEDVVAALSFDFWSNLFRPEYDRPIWQSGIKKLLINSEHTRATFSKIIIEINRLRNRIAHHEPIHHMDVSGVHSKILTSISLMNVETGSWVKHFSTVNQTLRTKPTKDSSDKPSFIDRADSNFLKVSVDDSLAKISSEYRFFLCYQEELVISVVDLSSITKFMLAQMDGCDLIIDMNSFSFMDIINCCGIKNNYAIRSPLDSLAQARSLFKKTGYILVCDNDMRGVIAKSHRLY